MILFLTAMAGASESTNEHYKKVQDLPDDTNKVNTFLLLCDDYQVENPDSSIYFADKAFSLSDKIFYRKGKAYAILHKGLALKNKGEFAKSLDYFLRSLTLMKVLNNIEGKARCFNIIGGVYLSQGYYNKSLSYFLDALKVYEAHKMEKEKAGIYNNIGNIHEATGNYKKALNNYYKAIYIYKKHGGKKKNFPIFLNNIGLIYELTKDYKKAIQYYNYSINEALKVNFKKGIASSYNHLGYIYYKNLDLENAEYCNKMSFEYYQKVKDKRGLILYHMLAARIAMHKSKNTISLKHCDSLLQNMKLSGNFTYLADYYQIQAEIFESESNYKQALEAFINYSKSNDSLAKFQNLNSISQLEVNYNFEKRYQAESLRKKRKETIFSIESRKNKIITYSAISGFILMLFIVFLLWRSYKSKNAIKQKLEHQKLELVTQSEELELVNSDLNSRNIQITSSINYALLIQKAILPSESILQNEGFEYFIYYKPKEIVSGDFYWIHKLPETGNIILCVADCSGHGISGALMSIIGHTILNSVIKENNENNAAEIVKQSNAKLIQLLSRTDIIKGEGMTLTVCVIDKTNKELTVSSARQRTYITDRKSFIIDEGTKYPLGTILPDEKELNFPETKVALTIQSLLYIGTDGIKNQISSDSSKKFKRSNFENLIREISCLEVSEQVPRIDETLNSWSNEAKQSDDILLIGLKKLIVIFLLILPGFLFSQDNLKLDSLKKEMAYTANDMHRIDILFRICDEYNTNNPDKAIVYASEALILAEINKNRKKTAQAYSILANAYIKKNDHYFAFINYSKALSIYKKTKDTTEIINTLIQQADILSYQKKFEDAIETLNKILQYQETNKTNKQFLSAIEKKADIYFKKNEYNRAAVTYFKLLKHTTDSSIIARAFLKLSKLYAAQKFINLSKENLNKAFKYCDTIASKTLYAELCNEYSLISVKTNDLEKAAYFNNTAERIFRLYGMDIEIGKTEVNKGLIYIKNNNISEAVKILNEGVGKLRKHFQFDDITKAYLLLSECYSEISDYRNALKYRRAYKSLLDSARNIENRLKLIQLESDYNFSKLSSEKNQKLKYEELLQSKKIENQKAVRNIILIVVILLFIIFLILIRNIFEKKKQNQSLYQINYEKEKQSEILKQNNEKLSLRNTEITDSIFYSKLIQETVFANSKNLTDIFSESFVIQMPKDIVSGDFFWMHKQSDLVYIVVADCTGHGVSGAFMSMIGNALLNNIIIDKKASAASEILDMLNNEITNLLKKDDGIQDDGMDITVCVYNELQKKLNFSSANQNVIIYSEDNLKVFEGDNYLIGGFFSSRSKSNFTDYTIDINTETTVYLCTDGWQDQFDSAQQNKFGSKQVITAIELLSSINIKEQETFIRNKIKDWMGSAPQTDDILITGFKIK